MSFYHGFGTKERHTVATRFHVAVDKICYQIRHFLVNNDAMPRALYRPLDAALSFVWGLNCRFPVKDVLLYTIWALKGYRAIQQVIQNPLIPKTPFFQWYKTTRSPIEMVIKGYPVREQGRTIGLYTVKYLRPSQTIALSETYLSGSK